MVATRGSSSNELNKTNTYVQSPLWEPGCPESRCVFRTGTCMCITCTLELLMPTMGNEAGIIQILPGNKVGTIEHDPGMW